MISTFLFLAQQAPGQAAVQHTAPVANDIDWWILALCILVGAALIMSGVGRILRYAAKGSNHEKAIELLGRVALILLCTAAGTVAGWRAWDAWLGGLVGFVGACASPIILARIFPYLDRFVGKAGK